MPRSLGREERVERLLLRLLVHPEPRVRDLEQHVAPRLDTSVRRRVRLVEGDVAGANREPSALRHRIPGVPAEVQDDLLKLILVGQDGVRVAVEIHDQLDAVADQTRHELQRLGNDRGRVDAHRLQDLLPAEGEELLRERGRMSGRDLDLVEGIEGALVLRRVRKQHRVAADHREDVVEVVRNAACERPDRFELLRLAELFVEPAVLRHVADRRCNPDDLPMVVPDR